MGNPEHAGVELQHFLTGINAPKNAAREKALKQLKAFAVKQGADFYDDDVDNFLLGDGYMLGLLACCGERSTGHEGGLKRTAATAMRVLLSLVCHSPPSGEENIWLSRLRHLPVEDFGRMSLEAHLLPPPKQSKDRSGAKEEACEIISLLLDQHFSSSAGTPEELQVFQLLPSEGAQSVYAAWAAKKTGFSPSVLTAIQKQRSNETGRSTSSPITGGGGLGDAADSPHAGSRAEVKHAAAKFSSAGAWASSFSRILVPSDLENWPSCWAEVDMKLLDSEVCRTAEDLGGIVQRDDAASAQARAIQDPLGLLSGDIREVQRQLDVGRRSSTTATRRRLNQAAEEPRSESDTVIPTEESFDPSLFMSVVHAGVSLDDVLVGMQSLRQAKDRQAEQLQLLVRDNFDSFVRCADSIEAYACQIDQELRSQLQDDTGSAAEELLQGEGATLGRAGDASKSRRMSLARLRLQLKQEMANEGKRAAAPGSRVAARGHLRELKDLVQMAQKEAAGNFSDLLDKLERIKQVKAAQHLLKEKGDVLRMPAEMRSALKERQWAQLVQLYRRAQSSLAGSMLRQQVREESTEVAKAACDKLLDMLRQPDASLEDQLAAVGFLVRLDHASGNPMEPLRVCLDSQTENFLLQLSGTRVVFGRCLEKIYGSSGASNLPLQTSDARSHGRRVHRRAFVAGETDSAISANQFLGSFADVDFAALGAGSGGALSGRFFEAEEFGSDEDEDHNPNAFAGGTDSDSSENFEQGSAPDRSGVRSGTGRRARGAHMHGVAQLGQEPPPGVDGKMHSVSVMRVHHLQNICSCISSWIPHLASLAGQLLKLERNHSVITTRRASLPTASTSSPQLPGSGEGYDGKEDQASGAHFSSLMRSWLTQLSQALALLTLGAPHSNVFEAYAVGKEGDDELFAPRTSPALQKMLQRQDLSALREPLASIYLQEILSPLKDLDIALHATAKSSAEAERLLQDGLNDLDEIVLQIQEAYISTLLDSMETRALLLKESECWRAPEPPAAPVGTLLPAAFVSLVEEELEAIAAVVPRPSAMAGHISRGIGTALSGLLKGIKFLVDDAYIATKDAQDGVASKGGNGGRGGKEVPLSTMGADEVDPDRQLLRQLANCLKLEGESLPLVRQTARRLFGPESGTAAAAEVDARAIAAMKDRIMDRYLKRMFKEFKMYIRAGWRARSGRTARSTSAVPAHHRRGPTAASVGEEAGDASQLSGGAPRYIRTRTQMERQRCAMLTGSPQPPGTNPQTLPAYLARVLLTLVKTRLDVTEALGSLPFRRKDISESGKPVSEILYADYILRESARLVMDLVCDCSNSRVAGKESFGGKPLGEGDPTERAEKVAQIEFLRDVLYKYLPSDTISRSGRALERIFSTWEQGNTAGSDARGMSPTKWDGSRDLPLALESKTLAMADMEEQKGRNRHEDGEDTEVKELQGASPERAPRGVNFRPKLTSRSGKRPDIVSNILLRQEGVEPFLTAPMLQEMARLYVCALK